MAINTTTENMSTTNHRIAHFFRMSFGRTVVCSSYAWFVCSYKDDLDTSSPMCSFLFRTITLMLLSSLLFSRNEGSFTRRIIFSWSYFKRTIR